MEQIYYCIALLTYSIFIVRFVLSWIGGDFEIDTDLDVSDVVSFKGLTHFLMGASSWLSVKNFITHDIQWYDYLICIILGIIFVVILFFVYKLMFKLEHKPVNLVKEDLVGLYGKVYLCTSQDVEGYYHYIVSVATKYHGIVDVDAQSKTKYETGTVVLLRNYIGTYFNI